ncbi:MAG: hypothetical protein ABEJ48_05880 [Halobacteriales archaeon]
MSHRRRQFLATLGAATFAGCADRLTGQPRTTTATSPAEQPTVSAIDPSVAYPHHRPSGNRVVDGTGAIPNSDPIDIDLGLDQSPAWIVGLSTEQGPLWAVVGQQGTTAGYRQTTAGIEPININPSRLPAGTPPVLVIEDGRPRLLGPPTANASELTHPLVLADGRQLIVEEDGSVVLWQDGNIQTRLKIDALLDARPVLGDGRVAVLTGATTRYSHGALGDPLEAGRITVLDIDDELAVSEEITIEDEAVVEGIAPILADLVGEGQRDIHVTVSDDRSGARQVVYGMDGTKRASGPGIGSGFRWRHQLAVAPFGPSGQRELAVVKTPHIGGVAEFYRPDDGSLSIAATREGYSTHALGSRNLDGALAGDFDDDGRVELLLPNQQQNALAGLRRTGTGVEEAWRRPIGAAMASNFAAVTDADDRITVAAGRTDGVLRLWPSGKDG